MTDRIEKRRACFLVLVLLVHFSGCTAVAQLGSVDQNARLKPILVVLGTYHMGTPGNNVVNGKVDDISTPERQKQVIELIERLKKFRPTKIAVECDIADDAKTEQAYNEFLAGKRELSKNETNQIGFRLAKELNLKKVHCVDWGIFPEDPLYNYEKYASKDAELNAFLKGAYKQLKEEVDAESAALRDLPVADQLAFLNRSPQIEKHHKIYFDLMRIGRGPEYAGANYVSWWYGRNMKILTNIIRITESSGDRILVVYGSGHLKLLNQLAQESGYYTLESPLKYLTSGKQR